jgi:hypothetical protein
MKAILEFDLDVHEDNMAHLRCVKSLDMMLVLWEMDQHLRAITKYAPDTQSDEVHQELLNVRNKLHEFMDDRGLTFDNFIE